MIDDPKTRFALAYAMYAMTYPTLVYNPGLGKPPMEFKPGSAERLRMRLARYVLTGVLESE